jgi:DNA-binding CsgD family transcriptional regulator
MNISTSPFDLPISERETQILELIANEYTTKEIACMLYVSPHTIDSHKKNLMNKLDVRNAAGMIRKGFELGILQIQNRSALSI